MLLWDVREAMEANEAKMLEGIIEKNKSKKSYYIFKHSNWTGHGMDTMKSTYMLRSSMPPRMLGTVLWKVDNEKGSIHRIWDLPLDVMVPGEYLDPHNSNELVHASAQTISGSICVS